jgi:uncharacterized membrane protein YfcA
MKSWVIICIGVAVAAVVGAKPLSRLRKPEKNDKLKIVLSVAIVLAAVVFAYQPRKALRGGGVKYLRPLNVYRGGAQCTVKGPQTGAGYQPYVIPNDLTVGGGEEIAAAVAIVPEIPVVEATYAIAAGVPDTTAVASGTSAVEPLSEVVVGGSLRLVGEF